MFLLILTTAAFALAGFFYWQWDAIYSAYGTDLWEKELYIITFFTKVFYAILLFDVLIAILQIIVIPKVRYEDLHKLSPMRGSGKEAGDEDHF
jgi:hypothetical protein